MEGLKMMVQSGGGGCNAAPFHASRCLRKCTSASHFTGLGSSRQLEAGF